MAYIDVIFTNQNTSVSLPATLNTNQTLKDIWNLLKDQNLVENDSDILKKSSGEILLKDVPINQLEINENETITVSGEGVKSSEKYSPELLSTDRNPVRRGERSLSPRRFHQLGIFVLDGSDSMSGTCANGKVKRDAVHEAMQSIIKKFKKSRKQQNFSFAIVNFSEGVIDRLGITPVSEMDEFESFDPTDGLGYGTEIFAGLERAGQIANGFLSVSEPNGVARSVVIVLMTDGECFEPEKTRAAADKLKQNQSIKICSSYLESEGVNTVNATQLMKDVCSNDHDFEHLTDAESIRPFFMRSISM